MQRGGVCVAWASSDWAAPACFPRRFASQVRNDDAVALREKQHGGASCNRCAVSSLGQFDWAAVLRVAVGDVANLGPVGAGNESLLHHRLRDALNSVGVLRVLRMEGRLLRQESGWTRAPGGIDVVATRPAGGGERALGIECKIGKPDELL